MTHTHIYIYIGGLDDVALTSYKWSASTIEKVKHISHIYFINLKLYFEKIIDEKEGLWTVGMPGDWVARAQRPKILSLINL